MNSIVCYVAGTGFVMTFAPKASNKKLVLSALMKEGLSKRTPTEKMGSGNLDVE